MIVRLLSLGIASLLLVTQVHAQWRSETYALKGGWNSIYLHGEATHASIETLFSSSPEVREIWRWIPNPDQMQFTSSPQLTSAGTPEWAVWVRGGSTNTLTELPGQSAYLFRCTGTAATSYSVTIVQRPLPPRSVWVRNGANLLGFPTQGSSSFPTFANYFTSFPEAIAPGAKIYRYVGGDISAANPALIFSPAIERVNRNQAYWFESEVVSNFVAPIHITLSNTQGLDYGRTGTVITARAYNRTASSMTLTVAPVISNAAPAGQDPITGSVPLMRRTFDTNSATWTETPLSTFNQVIAPKSSVEWSFGLDRNALTGASDALYASLLRVTDAGNLFDILLPARARKGSLAGLWIGEANVTAVESKAQADAVTPTGRSYPLRYLLHVADDGTARLLSQVFLGSLAAQPHNYGLCTKQTGLKADQLAEATRIVSAHLPLDRVVGFGTLTNLTDSLSGTISIPFDDPTNPFVHQYHPDHDNKDEKGHAIAAGFESYDVERQVTFDFTATPPAGSTVTNGWGSQVIGGTYAEVIQGLHQDTDGVGTGDGLHLTGTFELRRASELGSITLNP